MKGLWPLSVLGLLALGACSSSVSSPSPDGSTRPPLPSGVDVRFPAAPANAYLSLLTEDGQSVYQVSVAAGKTRTEVDPARWKAQSAEAQPIAQLVPDGAVITPKDVRVRLLHWVMWQDKNTNGQRDAGETLDLMTHDRVAYASAAVTVTFKTTVPDMAQTWKLAAGWSRAEHYVYLPNNTSTYLRSLESAQMESYTLHVETPVTSQ